MPIPPIGQAFIYLFTYIAYPLYLRASAGRASASLPPSADSRWQGGASLSSPHVRFSIQN